MVNHCSLSVGFAGLLRSEGAVWGGAEDLDFTAETTREKHGRHKRFRKLISGMPVAKLRARLVAMAADLDVTQTTP